MKRLGLVIVLGFSLSLLASGFAGAADDTRVKNATDQVEGGAKKIPSEKVGEGVKETAEGVGKTASEGAKYSNEKLKEAVRPRSRRRRARGATPGTAPSSSDTPLPVSLRTSSRSDVRDPRCDSRSGIAVGNRVTPTACRARRPVRLHGLARDVRGFALIAGGDGAQRVPAQPARRRRRPPRLTKTSRSPRPFP